MELVGVKRGVYEGSNKQIDCKIQFIAVYLQFYIIHHERE